MRIAVISTVYRPTPPHGYGGIERVVHEYAEGLLRAGHEVVLFACEGSRFAGRMVTVPPPGRSLTGISSEADRLSEEALYEAMRASFAANPVDVIHDWSFENLFVTRHPEAVPFLISSCIPVGPDYRRPNIVAASAAHVAALGGGIPFVHYGIDLSVYPVVTRKTEPAAHVAKVAPYKGQHEAVLAAMRSGMPLDLWGVVEHRRYNQLVLRPLLFLARRVRWRGEAHDLNAVLGQARALVQTPRWLDVLPLVVIQALACGTPIIAYPAGGLPEQVEHGRTGLLAEGIGGLAEALRAVDGIDPRACRAAAEEHFAVARMVHDYEGLFARVRDGETWSGGPGERARA